MAACDPWSDEELLRLLESRAMDQGDGCRNRALLAMQCATGGRISELLGLRRRDVVDEQGRVRPRVTFTRTKNKHPRTVELVSGFALPFVRAWLRRQQELGYFASGQPVFAASTGRALTRWWWYRLIRRACGECGMPGNYGTHSARKTWARNTYLFYQEQARSGAEVNPLLKLKEAGGWRSLDSVSHYLQFMLGDTRRSQEAIFRGLNGVYEKLAQNPQTRKGGA